MSHTRRTDRNEMERNTKEGILSGCLGMLKSMTFVALLVAIVRRLLRPGTPIAERRDQPHEREAEAKEMELADESQKEWLGAKWSTWGCLSVAGSLAIAGLAIITVVYGIFTTPIAFGRQGLLSPDPALMPPFEPPPERQMFIGIPPIGVPEFTTGQTLRLGENVLFTVTRTSLDWAPSPPMMPEIEYTMVEIQLVNNGGDSVQFSPQHFRMTTAREGPFEPVQVPTVPNRLIGQSVLPGDRAEGILVFARPDVRQVRRYLIYEPPFHAGTIRVLLVP